MGRGPGRLTLGWLVGRGALHWDAPVWSCVVSGRSMGGQRAVNGRSKGGQWAVNPWRLTPHLGVPELRHVHNHQALGVGRGGGGVGWKSTRMGQPAWVNQHGPTSMGQPAWANQHALRRGRKGAVPGGKGRARGSGGRWVKRGAGLVQKLLVGCRPARPTRRNRRGQHDSGKPKQSGRPRNRAAPRRAAPCRRASSPPPPLTAPAAAWARPCPQTGRPPSRRPASAPGR